MPGRATPRFAGGALAPASRAASAPETWPAGTVGALASTRNRRGAGAGAAAAGAGGGAAAAAARASASAGFSLETHVAAG